VKALSARVTLAMVLAASLVLAAQSLLASVSRSVNAQSQSGWQVVHILYRGRADLDRLASQLDVWEVQPESDTLVARVSPTEYDWLLSQGYSVTVDSLRSQQILDLPGYPCYRTVSQLYADEDVFASMYPTLTQIITLGVSYEGRPLRVLKLTNQAHVVSDKPRFFLMANIHGREFITPEAAMQFVRLLLEGYGHDPDATWLLDWREMDVLVTANPDGHTHNETNFVFWRKNANPENQGICTPDYQGDGYGTDLNRNSSFAWGSAGSSAEPCYQTYRGKSPASDLETQAIQDYVASLFPDQRGPLITDAAPLTTTGILISLHSYSNLVLWPWGYTDASAPNAAQLTQLGQKLASYNHYYAQPASGLYLASGTTDDWSYGTLGIASYTFEMGSEFLPSCSEYDALIQPNLDALLYAARVARAPYQLSDGPDAAAPTISVAVGTGALINMAYLTATITSPGHIISAAQAYVDAPPWAGGAPLSMSAIDGRFDQTTEVVGATLDTLHLTLTRHTVFVRGQDALGNWGPASATWLDLTPLHTVYLPLIARP
jgi:carboxypeptidase T